MLSGQRKFSLIAVSHYLLGTLPALPPGHLLILGSLLQFLFSSGAWLEKASPLCRFASTNLSILQPEGISYGRHRHLIEFLLCAVLLEEIKAQLLKIFL